MYLVGVCHTPYIKQLAAAFNEQRFVIKLLPRCCKPRCIWKMKFCAT